ncbi:hypothetical protein, partial [Chryseobacterium sp. CH25]|uniref:hypothetical protein n=1 Tax=Chryseobacterium sp. CH25 TaxID=713559 RepID=UPI0010255350
MTRNGSIGVFGVLPYYKDIANKNGIRCQNVVGKQMLTRNDNLLRIKRLVNPLLDVNIDDEKR